MQSQPFRRLNIFITAARALMAQSGLSIHQALALQPAYRSRGKGKNVSQKARHGKHMDSVRAARKAHNITKRSAK